MTNPPPESAGATSSDRPAGADYDAQYFEHYEPRTYERNDYWLSLFGAVADRIVARIKPKRALDAGCALGVLVEVLRDRGVDAEGVDLSAYAIAHVYEPVRPYCRVASVTDDLPLQYDLITCIEVLEHLPPPEAERAVANFCRHTDDVLFSSTPMHYRDVSHLNVQPPEYWAERFAEHGFYRDTDFDASFVSPWAVRFRRGRDPVPRVIAGYERGYARISYERNELRSLAHDKHQEAAGLLAQSVHVKAALEETHAHLTRKLQELGDAHNQIRSLDAELHVARVTVQNMERSIFWRARRMWVSIRRLLSGRGQ